MTFTTANDKRDYGVEEILKYPSHTLVLDCRNFEDFEQKLSIARNSPYWHPHTNSIVYYRNNTESNAIIAKIFFGLWYYKSINAVILQYNDNSKRLMITYYNPYISEEFKLEHSYGCWTHRKITVAVRNLQDGIVCVKGCHNVTLHSKLRADYLGTCIGFESISIPYGDITKLRRLKLFEDKAKNLHGFPLRAYANEVMPFFLIDVNDDGTYTIHQRDGFIWNSMAKIMNFKLDLSINEKVMKSQFDFEVSIQEIYDFSRRKGDLLLFPLYQFDLVIVEIDMTVPFKESGVCFMSHRTGFETVLFDVKIFQTHYIELIQFIFCFLGIWLVFFVFNAAEKNIISFDQAGKDLVNAIRNILSISLYKPPKKSSFRIFLLISIWSFFVMNFATQAAIISFFSAAKRGKEVETFDDITEKGYVVEGMASPDVMLPETEEKFKRINAKLVPIRDLFACVKHMTNDSRRFCLIDCSVGRYLERNLLNEKGEQYLHIARDQVHNNYLNMILQKHSPLTDEYNRNMHKFLQAGLINKWEQYRYTDIKYEAPVKSLDMADLIGIFKCYMFLVMLSILTFLTEVATGASFTRNLFKC